MERGSTYYMNEGALELGGLAFRDHTVNRFEARHAEHGEIALVVVRGQMVEGESLRDAVTKHVILTARSVDGYALLDERDTEHAGAPALEVDARYRHEGQVIYERQAHLGLPVGWMYFAASGPLRSREVCDALLASVLSTLRTRDGA